MAETTAIDSAGEITASETLTDLINEFPDIDDILPAPPIKRGRVSAVSRSILDRRDAYQTALEKLKAQVARVNETEKTLAVWIGHYETAEQAADTSRKQRKTDHKNWTLSQKVLAQIAYMMPGAELDPMQPGWTAAVAPQFTNRHAAFRLNFWEKPTIIVDPADGDLMTLHLSLDDNGLTPETFLTIKRHLSLPHDTPIPENVLSGLRKLVNPT